jgi:hypothetical protein
MFLLYHSEGCNIFESVLRECYVNDLYTTTCSGVLGHCMILQILVHFLLTMFFVVVLSLPGRRRNILQFLV